MYKKIKKNKKDKKNKVVGFLNSVVLHDNATHACVLKMYYH